MKTSEDIKEIAKALAIAQGEIRPASKDGNNPHFKSKFSTLASAWEVIRGPLSAQGLTVLQDLTLEDKTTVCVTTRILHTSGQWIEFGPLCVPMSKNDAQGVGSASSYAKRYALCGALGIVSTDDDDDGEGAVGRKDISLPKNPQIKEESIPVDVKISNNELSVLEALLNQLSLTDGQKWTDSLLGFLKIDQLKEMPKSAFDKACMSLNAKIKQSQDGGAK